MSRGRGHGGNRASPLGRGARGVSPRITERTPSSTAATMKNARAQAKKSPKKKPKKGDARRGRYGKDTQPQGRGAERPRASGASEARKENDRRREISRKDTQPCVCSGVPMRVPGWCCFPKDTQPCVSCGVCERGDCPARASEQSERSLIDEVCAALFMPGCCVSR